MDKFKEEILAGIPQDRLPEPKPYDKTINHAPKRKDILTAEEKVLALKNALRYFPAKFHAELAPEFAKEQASRGLYPYPVFGADFDKQVKADVVRFKALADEAGL